ncbi:MAG: GntR family transcriptional regulator [Anaerolineales bacterium]|nr:GntR family transcriptional regulator [Anaerolineales bacterium]
MSKDSHKQFSKRQPLYQQASVALDRILANAAPGTLLPSEPALAQQLGVSRATLREAMRTVEDRGLIVRKQGIGTYVTSPPAVMDTGLEVLESVETLAKRMGLDVEMTSLSIREYEPRPHEASIFEIPSNELLLEVSRTIRVEGKPVAFLVDSLPKKLVPYDIFGNGFKGSVLDLLLEKGEPELAHSKTEITAISATKDLAQLLEIGRGSVLLKLDAFLYGKDWRAIDHSISYFLPDTFRFHVLRKVETFGVPF